MGKTLIDALRLGLSVDEKNDILLSLMIASENGQQILNPYEIQVMEDNQISISRKTDSIIYCSPEQISRSYDAVKKCLDAGFPVIAHIQTGGNTKPTCLGYKYDYGHYVHLNKAKDNKFLVADPTKGLKWCVASQIIKATNGRNIKFYKVEIL